MSELFHNLTKHFPKLGQHHSTSSLESSSLYQELETEIQQVLKGHEIASQAEIPPAKKTYRTVAWNIERGRCFDGIVDRLKNDPRMSTADIYLLSEVDLGMARSANRHVARDLAEALGLNYAFAPSYLNLSKGCGHEAEYEGDNELGLHGNAILSRYPLSNIRTAMMPNGKDKMRGNEKRIGHQRGLIADVQLGDHLFTTSCVHLDAHSSQRHRVVQMRSVLNQFNDIPQTQPILIGGDWNTSTYNSSRALHAIIGFWIRVAMGPDNMIRNHYAYPDRRWEKELFQMLEQEGFDYKNLNQLGTSTLVYDVRDIEQYKNLGEWIPEWCFKFIRWSLRNHNGQCPFKLDWFAGRGLKAHHNEVTEIFWDNDQRVSDHAAIITDFSITAS